MKHINYNLKKDENHIIYLLILFVKIIYSLFIIPLSYIIPKKENSYLMGAGKGFLFKGNTKYLYLYILKSGIKCKLNWITANEKIYSELKKRNYPVLKLFSIKGFWGILRSKYLVVEMSIRDIYYINRLWGNFNLIQTWHGTPLKRIWIHMKKDKKGITKNKLLLRLIPFKVLKKMKIFSFYKYKLIPSPSKEVSAILTKASLNKNVRLLGYPRNDVFFNRDLIFDNLKEKLNLKMYRKVVLYCPTFRDNYKSVKPFSDDFLKNMNSFFRKNGDLFLIKKHPLEINIEIIKNLSNIKDVSTKVEDIQELLIFTDILITDYSSVFFDFLLLDKPIIYYSYDYDEYLENCRGMYYNYYKEIPGPFAKKEEELLELIKNVDIWFNDKKYQLKYKKFKDKFNYYQDGKSCERLLEAIKKNKLKK